MVYDLDWSFADGLRVHAPSPAQGLGVLARESTRESCTAHQNLGLQLTSVTDHYDFMQLVKAQLKNSADPDIRVLWEARRAREAGQERLHKVSRLDTEAEAQVT